MKTPDPLLRHFVERLHRRNLTINERALIAAKMAGLANGSNRFEKKTREDVGVVETTPILSMAQAAEVMGVSRDTVACAKVLRLLLRQHPFLAWGKPTDEESISAPSAIMISGAADLMVAFPVKIAGVP